MEITVTILESGFYSVCVVCCEELNLGQVL